MKSTIKNNTTQFIAAQESDWFIRLFDMYVRNLFWRRFNDIRIQAEYLPEPGDRTIYYLNHTSWWDGLIPFLLNQKLFKQKARAMMEDKQIHRHRFFKKIGAFSVNLTDKRSSVRSLRYAINSMERENASLFIYPEGRIVPFSTEKPQFKDGLSWIISKLEEIQVVPVGVYITNQKSDKPELYLKTGKEVKISNRQDSVQTKELLEVELQQLLIRLVQDVHIESSLFRKL